MDWTKGNFVGSLHRSIKNLLWKWVRDKVPFIHKYYYISTSSSASLFLELSNVLRKDENASNDLFVSSPSINTTRVVQLLKFRYVLNFFKRFHPSINITQVSWNDHHTSFIKLLYFIVKNIVQFSIMHCLLSDPLSHLCFQDGGKIQIILDWWCCFNQIQTIS